MTDKERTGYLISIKDGAIELTFDVYNEQKVKIATLKPLTINDVYIGSKIVKFMTKWRIFYKDRFFTQFKATEERTLDWLRNRIMKDNNRIFFAILDTKDKIIAHIGVIFYKNSICELDNLVKDINCKIPGIITFTEKKLVKWLFKEMHMKKITGRLFSDNIKARALHKKCGFKEVEEIEIAHRKVLLIELKPNYIY